MASGVGITTANDSIRETTYRAVLRLSRDVGYPELESPVVNGIRTNIGELQIFPPGMHQAFTSDEVITFTSQRQPGASLRNAVVAGIRRSATRRTRASCALSRLS